MSSTQLIGQQNSFLTVLNENDSNETNKTTYNNKKSSVVIQRKISSEVPGGVTKKSMLLYLVRMGSFQSPIPKMPEKSPGCDDALDSIEFQKINTDEQMMKFCLNKLPMIEDQKILKRKEITRRKMQLDSPDIITVMQWNMLSQAMGFNYEKFESCNQDQMNWAKRKWKIVIELLQYHPVDIICLQEVDHFDFLLDILEKIGYQGKFLPKPDSPCYYIMNNTGPDGCAIFWKTDKLTLISSAERILEVYQCQSNQVVLGCHLKMNSCGYEFCVGTTHLKARSGPILSALRNEQGKDLLDFLSNEFPCLPIVLTGDFNAEPTEPVYDTIKTKLSSAYCDGLNQEPQFTNWTKREGEKENKRTLDYIFYSKSSFELVSLLSTESNQLNGPIPNSQYPSDHVSLLARFKINYI